MSFLYNFGHCQEDPRSEAAALGLPGGRVVSIAAAGDMPLDLLALGAERVVGVDLDAPQLHLGRLKLAAATTLAREETVRLLGWMPAPPAARRRWLAAAAAALPADARAFWAEHGEATLARGALWSGRYERFVDRLRRIATPLLGRRIRRLVGAAGLAEQRRIYAEEIDGRLLALLFRVAFHPRLYARRGMDPRGLGQRGGGSLGAQFHGRFRQLCTVAPAGDNPWLQLHALGEVRALDAVPTWLGAAGYARVRERAREVSFVEADLGAHLAAAPAGSFDRFHLSNLGDWMPAAAFAALLGTIAARAARPARLVWRFIHVDHPAPALPGLVVERELGARLDAADRFPFYTIVPARLEALR